MALESLTCDIENLPLLWSCRDFFYVIRGFWLGVIVTVAIQAWFLRRLLVGPAGSKPRTAIADTRLNKEESGLDTQTTLPTDQFPENVVSWLRKATAPTATADSLARGMVDSSPTETCFFLNVYVHRYFLELRRSELLKARWKLKVLEKLAHRMETLSMISSLTFTDFDFGNEVPMFHGARVLKYFSDKAEITLEVDTTYKGGLTVGVEVTLATGGITIPVVVKLTGLAGKMRIRVPSRVDPLHFDITFAEDPNATFEVVSGLYLKDSEYLKETLTKYLSSKVSKLFSDFWTYPAWRNLELPMINRKVTDPIDIPKYVGVVRETIDGKPMAHVWRSGKLTNLAVTPAGTAIAGTSSAASKGPAAAPVKKAPVSAASVPDVLSDAVFLVDTVVRAANVEQLQTRLSTLFLQLAKEETKVTGKGLEAWKTIKSKDGITHQRKKILLPGTVAGSALTASEFNRTIFRVAVDPDRVFQILSKPEHQRLVTDAFSGAIEIKRFDENSTVWFYKYRFGKTGAADRIIKVFELRRKRVDLGAQSESQANLGSTSTKPGGSTAWLVVYRSIAGITPDEEPQGLPERLDAILTTNPLDEPEHSLPSLPVPEPAEGDDLSLKGERDSPGDDVSLAPLDEWPESAEDKELAESLRSFASQSSLKETPGTSPMTLPAKADGPPAMALPLSTVATASANLPVSTSTPPATPSLTFSDLSSGALKGPQSLNQSSSSTSITSASGSSKPAVAQAPTGTSSRLPSLMRSSTAGAEKTAVAVKGDGGFPLEEHLRVHLYGYLVESVPDDPHASVVTMLTQYSSKSIARLESSWDICRQLKISIEELASLSSLPGEEGAEETTSGAVLRKSVRHPSGPDDGENKSATSERGQRMEKLKTLAAGAGKKAYSWWSGKSSGQSSTIGNAVAAGAVISSTFDAADNTLSSSKLLDPSQTQTVLFDDDSEDDGASEHDYRSGDEEDGGGTLPKEAQKRSRMTRFLRKATEKVHRQADDAGEVASIHSQQGDDGDSAETRSLGTTEPGGADDTRHPDAMTTLEGSGPEKQGVAMDIKRVPYQDFVITSKQGARLDVSFNGDFTTATELAWEFKVKSPDAVNFAVLFKPLSGKRLSTASLGSVDDRFVKNLTDSDLEPGAKVIIPLTPVFAMSRAVRGRLATSGFPAGTFVVLWDNAYHRKSDKTLSYKVKLQPIRVLSTPHIPRPHFSQELSSAVVVKTRTAFRAQLFYTEEIERLSIHGSSSPSQNPDRGQTYLQWEFSTGGYDIFFKINFTPVDPDVLATIRTTSDASIESAVDSVKIATTSSPPATPSSIDESRSLNETTRSFAGSSPVSTSLAVPDASQPRSLSWSVPSTTAGTGTLHGSNRNIVIVPSVKCNSQKGSISGSLLITGKTGIYTFVWDNSSSLVTNKHIAFRAGTLTFT